MQNTSSLRDVLTHYDKRFAQATLDLPMRNPADASAREEILRVLRTSLGIQHDWVPQVTVTGCEGRQGYDGYHVERLRATTWPGCYTAAHLYVPDETGGAKPPLVTIVCGHADKGKQAPGYRALAQLLARAGCAVLIADNIGQGERVAMGHRSVPAIFGVGLSLQGLIAMEAMGWLAWIKQETRFDHTRLGLAGNSGGGLLSLLLGALCRDTFTAIASSGYPSTFDFIARKEKQHCHCNLLPGIIGKLEMWQVYGAMAPKSLFLFQGSSDPLFPEDLFYSTAARVADVYREAGADEQFRFALYPGGHSWDTARHIGAADYLCKQLGLEFAPPADVLLDDDPGECYSDWPGDALTATGIAFRLSGRTHPATALCHVTMPQSIPPGESKALRGDTADIFAQFELFLKE